MLFTVHKNVIKESSFFIAKKKNSHIDLYYYHREIWKDFLRSDFASLVQPDKKLMPGL